MDFQNSEYINNQEIVECDENGASDASSLDTGYKARGKSRDGESYNDSESTCHVGMEGVACFHVLCGFDPGNLFV